MNLPPLVLASASPRRLDLLAQIGIVPTRIAPADIDESVRRDELPRPYVQRMAREKAAAIDGAGAFVLAADTVVAVGRRILPKAESEAEARACLTLMSGRRHRVMTAVVLVSPNGLRRERLCESVVGLARLTSRDIDTYVASQEWRGKAGGYAIQGKAASFIRFLSGSHSNVVGLPLFETAQLLRGSGWCLP
ncbi:MAG: nucleoside triphosphate pyrophosphatase [Acetobacteraceae bacterium]